MDDKLRLRLEALISDLPGPDQPLNDPAESDLSDNQLLARLRDPQQSATQRLADLRHLTARHRVDHGAAEAFQILLSDPDEAIVLGAIAEVPAFDLAALDRLRLLLDHARPAIRQASARALARRKDRTLLPRMGLWLQSDDSGNRQAAIDVLAWLADPHDGNRLLASAWEIPTLDAEERIALARLLAERGDDRVADWLVEIFEENGQYADSARQALEILLFRAENADDSAAEQGGSNAMNAAEIPGKAGNPG